MGAIEKKMRIDSNGALLEYNERLRRWEMVTGKSWSWDDIDPDYLEESRENYSATQEDEEF